MSEPNYRTMYCKVMDALKRSRLEHGDCESGDRYNGKPLACSACMAKIELDKMLSEYKGWTINLA